MAGYLYVLIFSALMMTSLASAKECKFVVSRDICEGKSADELLKPYNRQRSFADVKDFSSQKECLTAAETAAKIVRPGQFKNKKVDQIFFDGQEIKQVFEDKKDCK